ncbi:hypothetical protein HD806DRAFT_529760 [Xylariaceae sp. AK1471]|nr:hypothetical protein HD806DRAFT_529760 [Xylariaceae sp. AK1471]
MSQANVQIGTGAAEITVETNNFHQVLEHFKSSGNLINQRTTRVEINCQICQIKNLAVVNPQYDEHSLDTHESYVVLPRCGHAFGHMCLKEWVNKSEHWNPSCPSCRSPIYCEKKHVVPFKICGSRIGNDVTYQAMQIRGIRDMLHDPSCKRCQGKVPEKAKNEGRQIYRQYEARPTALHAERPDEARYIQEPEPIRLGPNPAFVERQARDGEAYRQAVLWAAAWNAEHPDEPQYIRGPLPGEVEGLRRDVDRMSGESAARQREIFRESQAQMAAYYAAESS